MSNDFKKLPPLTDDQTVEIEFRIYHAFKQLAAAGIAVDLNQPEVAANCLRTTIETVMEAAALFVPEAREALDEFKLAE